MQHGWDHVYAYRAGKCLRCIVLCRYCQLMAVAAGGSSPHRPPPCDGARPPPAPIEWATHTRAEPTARYFWLIRSS